VIRSYTRQTDYYIVEVIGFAARAGAYNATGDLAMFLIQAIFLLLPPVFFAAALYMVYSRIVRAVHGAQFSVISPRRTTMIFVWGDMLCLNVQSTGSGLLANPKHEAIGNSIIIAGLFLQIAVFILFMACCVSFHRRFREHVSTTGEVIQVPWRSYVHMLYTTSLLILSRNLYRVVEYIMGADGYLNNHEWPVYVFDGSLMLLVMVGFFIWYPSRLVIPDRESMIELTDSRAVTPVDYELSKWSKAGSTAWTLFSHLSLISTFIYLGKKLRLFSRTRSADEGAKGMSNTQRR